MADLLSSFKVGDFTARYWLDPGTGRVGLDAFPTTLEAKLCPPRKDLADLPYIKSVPILRNSISRLVDSLVQLRIAGDPVPFPFAQGRTLRGYGSLDRFRFSHQECQRNEDETTVLTTHESEEGLRLEHRLTWRNGDTAVRVESVFFNGSTHAVELEMLSSFSLSNITPFDPADAHGRLNVHRFRSGWSAEGRLETRSIEELHLERSWTNSGVFSERFGQVGSAPVRGWFPFVAIEDVVAGVTWAVQLAWAGSWQMEIFRRFDDVCLSGGLADWEFGHWSKRVRPGEKLVAPPAFLTCVAGGLDEACDSLMSNQQREADRHPAVEHDLPVIFNEWCTSWGNPRHETLIRMADRLKDSGVKYLVIDAGWFKTEKGGHGDWNPSEGFFPEGLAATARAIRERGLIPGLWFEMETCTANTAAFLQTDHQLHFNRKPLTVGGRRFLDLNDPWVIDYLSDKVIGQLRRYGFGYLKVDYNDTIGIGCDHPDSYGEGLRRQTEGTYRFFEKIRHDLPDIVIENCASGGHRLEPSMISRSSMSSFSDAHELPEIPIIAANLQRLVTPRQLQVWAVVHPTDSMDRLAYSLAAGFLGRICLSGEITEMDSLQWEKILQAIRHYQQVVPVLKNGVSRRFGDVGKSWRYPTGWQGVVRLAQDGCTALIVIHAFASAPEQVTLPLPKGEWEIEWEWPSVRSAIVERKVASPIAGPFTATILSLHRTDNNGIHGSCRNRLKKSGPVETV